MKSEKLVQNYSSENNDTFNSFAQIDLNNTNAQRGRQFQNNSTLQKMENNKKSPNDRGVFDLEDGGGILLMGTNHK